MAVYIEAPCPECGDEVAELLVGDVAECVTCHREFDIRQGDWPQDKGNLTETEMP